MALHDRVLSDPDLLVSDVELLSPPSNWPNCFKDDEELRKFLGKRGLQSRRCRLIASVLPEDVAAQAASIKLHPKDSFENAMLIKHTLGWEVVKGFGVFGVDGRPSKFVGLKRWWNCTPSGTWVDLTPQKPAVSTEVGAVMAESDLAVSRERTAEDKVPCGSLNLRAVHDIPSPKVLQRAEAHS